MGQQITVTKNLYQLNHNFGFKGAGYYVLLASTSDHAQQICQIMNQNGNSCVLTITNPNGSEFSGTLRINYIAIGT